MTDLSKITCIEDLRQVAQRRVPRMFYDYADSGSWTEGTYRANEADFQSIKLRQRVAINMEGRSTKTTMIGQDVAMPVAIAPTGLTGMQHADGEILGARAAKAFGIPFTLSTMSICSIEDIATATDRHPFMFQVYVLRDRAFMERLIDRAKAANCSALQITLDLQILGQRHKDIKNGLTAPPKLTLPNIINMATKPRWCLGMLGTKRREFGNIVGHVTGVDNMSSLSAWTAQQFDPTLNWNDVEWIKKRWGGKIVLKGIQDAEDARHAVNSGRRCLDRLQPRGSPAGRRALLHHRPAGHRGCCGQRHRTVDGRRHSQWPRCPQSPRPGRTWHHDWPRLALRTGRVRPRGRDEDAANHPQRAGFDHGILRADRYQHGG